MTTTYRDEEMVHDEIRYQSYRSGYECGAWDAIMNRPPMREQGGHSDEFVWGYGDGRAFGISLPQTTTGMSTR